MRAGEEYSKSHDDLAVFVAAFTHSNLGNKDRAFAWLDKVQRNWYIIYLKRDDVWNRFAPIHGSVTCCDAWDYRSKLHCIGRLLGKFGPRLRCTRGENRWLAE